MKTTMTDTKATKEDTKKTKEDTKEKRLKDKKAKQMESKKFHRRLISLFCCCILSQEKNEEFNEMEQSTAKNESIDLNN